MADERDKLDSRGARVLAHSYRHDSRPPEEVVERALAYPISTPAVPTAPEAPAASPAAPGGPEGREGTTYRRGRGTACANPAKLLKC